MKENKLKEKLVKYLDELMIILLLLKKNTMLKSKKLKLLQKIYQQIGGAPDGIPPNFQLGAGPSAGSKGTASGGAEDVE